MSTERAPKNATEGDYYMDMHTMSLYKRVGGTWQFRQRGDPPAHHFRYGLKSTYNTARNKLIRKDKGVVTDWVAKKQAQNRPAVKSVTEGYGDF